MLSFPTSFSFLFAALQKRRRCNLEFHKERAIWKKKSPRRRHAFIVCWAHEMQWTFLTFKFAMNALQALAKIAFGNAFSSKIFELRKKEVFHETKFNLLLISNIFSPRFLSPQKENPSIHYECNKCDYSDSEIQGTNEGTKGKKLVTYQRRRSESKSLWI